MNTNPKIVVAIDIGTTKVCAMIGTKDEYNKLEILGASRVESVGVLRGVVSNIERTVDAIKNAVSEVERQSGLPIKKVHVGIAGQHIKSLQHRGILTRDNSHSEISRTDIEKLIADMYKLVLPPGDKIIHAIPQEYIVDNEQGIIDPIGMSGVRLEANFHIITGQITASKNLYRCVERAGLETVSLTLEPIASAEAVLSVEEKEAGIALVDIGGGTTDLAIFHEGIIRHTAVIPFGGNIITKDIKEGCKVMDKQAEQLKIKFGSALANEVHENRIITIPGLRGREPKEISEKNLALIIQARMEEIFDHIYWEIRRSGYDRKLIGGIVLTGGGSLLRHLPQLAELHTGMNARLGIPVEHLAHGYDREVTNPMYSTAIGLLLKGLEDNNVTVNANRFQNITETKKEVKDEQNMNLPVLEKETKDNNTKESRPSRWYENIFKKTKEWFEAEPDSDF